MGQGIIIMKRLVVFVAAIIFVCPTLAQELELSAHDDRGNLRATNVGRTPVTILSAKVNYRDECALVGTANNVLMSATLVGEGPDKFSKQPVLLKTGDRAIIGVFTTPCYNAEVVAIEIETDQGVVEFTR